MDEVTGGSGSGGSANGGFTRAVAETRVGRRLGARWMLDKVLGIGGSACVYAAHHRNGRRAAVKVLHPDSSFKPRSKRRFLSEGYAANQVGHPGAVAIFDDGEEPDGTVFLVMELLSGKSLSQWLDAEGPRSELDVARAAVGVLDVLAAAHDRGILHRDIKPSNVFRTNEGEIKVLDFGSARVHGDASHPTGPGTVLGTPAFMAPELASGRIEDVDARTDIWAVGATMFQLLTGVTVHGARTTEEALVKAATIPAPLLASKRAGASAELAAIVDRALAFSPSERWANAKAMREALANAFGLAGAEPAQSQTTIDSDAAATPKRIGRPPTSALMFAVVLGVVVLVTIFAQTRKPAQTPPRPTASVAAITGASEPRAAPGVLAIAPSAPAAATPLPEHEPPLPLRRRPSSPGPAISGTVVATPAPSASAAVENRAPENKGGTGGSGASGGMDDDMLDRWK